MSEIRLMKPGPNGQVINEYGIAEKPPSDWAFLKAGDAAVTRKVTAAGPIWRVQVKKGRRLQSLGIWAPQSNISQAKIEVEAIRADPGYAKKQASAAKTRARKQENYMAEFQMEVAKYLNFHSRYADLQSKIAKLVTAHAIPIGSGTVARTSMLPVEERAGKAVIAWMRHKTTNYDNLKIARIKGERRKVRKQLAQRSLQVLKTYRNGEAVPMGCPLWRALNTENVA
ncbi:MAG: hypothetical protein CMB80_11735 [Flammeovirgaceae bacterium]|nr:hypothetical protein [Flammeovirgaceae bacterium]MBR10847.1 hypothetical protein [Rickettsiales bacterium]